MPFPLRHPLPFPHPLALLCQSEISIHSPTSTFFPIRSSPRFQSAIQSLLPPPPPSPDPLLPCVFNLRFQSFLPPAPPSLDSLLPRVFRSSPLCDFNPPSTLHPLFSIPSYPKLSICDFNPTVFLYFSPHHFSHAFLVFTVISTHHPSPPPPSPHPMPRCVFNL